jgi:hypothetical protein
MSHALDLRTIARALDGEVSGRQVLAPGPGHSRKDRSLSVTIAPAAPDGFLAHSHAGDDWRTVRDYVRERCRLGRAEFARQQRRGPATSTVPGTDTELKRVALFLWARRRPIEGTPAEAYLRQARGYSGPIPATLGYLPARGEHGHAMIAAFGIATEPEPGLLAIADDAVRGIHLTKLNADGTGKAEGESSAKKMIGKSSGFPICIAPPNDLLGIAITEGIEDALSVHQATGLGAWAAGSAGRMPALADKLPDYIECCTIWAHSDPAGQAGAIGLADKLLARGIEAIIQGIAQ